MIGYKNRKVKVHRVVLAGRVLFYVDCFAVIITSGSLLGGGRGAAAGRGGRAGRAGDGTGLVPVGLLGCWSWAVGLLIGWIWAVRCFSL